MILDLMDLAASYPSDWVLVISFTIVIAFGLLSCGLATAVYSIYMGSSPVVMGNFPKVVTQL